LKLRHMNNGGAFNIRCFHYKKEYHIKRFYPKRKKNANNLGRLFGSCRLSSFNIPHMFSETTLVGNEEKSVYN